MILLFFFFKQKTAYEMRISDWSSDVCSSDLSPSGRRISAACAISPREAARRGWKRTGGRRDGDGKSSPKRGGGPRAARWRGRAPNAPARSVRRAQASSRTVLARNPDLAAGKERADRAEIPQATPDWSLCRRFLLFAGAFGRGGGWRGA